MFNESDLHDFRNLSQIWLGAKWESVDAHLAAQIHAASSFLSRIGQNIQDDLAMQRLVMSDDKTKAGGAVLRSVEKPITDPV